MSRYWWWGTYPEAGMGTPTGLGEGVWRMDPVAGGASKHAGAATLALELPSPSFVLAHPDLPILYAITEEEKSSAVAIDISDPMAPVVVGTILTGGWGACHGLLAHDTLTLYVSHYSSGHVSVIPLGADGLFGTTQPLQVLAGAGGGPVPRRQDGSHAHSAGYAPDGETLLVADLGTDELRRFVVLADGSLRADGVAARLEPGSGPRHFAVRGDLLYVACELSHTLVTLRWDPETRTATALRTIDSTLVPLRTEDAIYDAHVIVVGDVVLGSIRGSDVISVYDLDPAGLPAYRGALDSGGSYPRYFAVLGESLVVGNEKSHVVSVFDLADVLRLVPGEDPAVPVELPHTNTRVLSPACVVEA